MIKVENVSFKYKNSDKKIVDNLNFEVKDGEIIAIVGQNGSGKSTIGKLISGIIKLKQGNITVDDLMIKDKKVQDKIGIVFQNPENQIIFNNIYYELSFSLKGLEKSEIERRIENSLQQVGMLEYKNNDLYSLSLGQKQRIMIAEVLTKKPKYIIFDEPTTIFFLPNNKFIMLLVVLNLCIMLISKLHLKEVMATSIHVLPVIIFTFIINYMLDNFYNALWMGVKLFIVCNITIVYSETTNVLGIAETIKTICYPLKLFKVNTDDIKVMICISLSVIPILKKDLYELKEACKAKKITLNLKNIKIVLVKFFLSLILRVNEIEESLIAKGFSNE